MTSTESKTQICEPCHAKKDRTLFPEIEPYKKDFLKVSDLHTIYYELCGNPNGKPVVVLHGGPGGGIAAYYRQYFDPKVYNIVLLDQRGSGQSTPRAELKENTTWNLVQDIEKLRKLLNIESWVVFGGSWGSTLSLAYAVSHPDRVKALILRGIFLLRDDELQWFYQKGASHIFPDLWEKYLEPIPESERNHMIHAYYRRLTGDNEEEKLKCATAWSVWEMSTSRLYVDPAYIKRAADEGPFAITFARIESHYFVNAGFFPRDGWLLEKEQMDKIKNIPTTIVQGRYDLVCPAQSAWDLYKASDKKFELIWADDCGHSAKEDAIISELVKAAEKYSAL